MFILCKRGYAAQGLKTKQKNNENKKLTNMPIPLKLKKSHPKDRDKRDKLFICFCGLPPRWSGEGLANDVLTAADAGHDGGLPYHGEGGAQVDAAPPTLPAENTTYCLQPGYHAAQSLYWCGGELVWCGGGGGVFCVCVICGVVGIKSIRIVDKGSC